MQADALPREGKCGPLPRRGQRRHRELTGRSCSASFFKMTGGRIGTARSINGARTGRDIH
jgi:hypothetical protein